MTRWKYAAVMTLAIGAVSAYQLMRRPVLLLFGLCFACATRLQFGGRRLAWLQAAYQQQRKRRNGRTRRTGARCRDVVEGHRNTRRGMGGGGFSARCPYVWWGKRFRSSRCGTAYGPVCVHDREGLSLSRCLFPFRHGSADSTTTRGSASFYRVCLFLASTVELGTSAK